MRAICKCFLVSAAFLVTIVSAPASAQEVDKATVVTAGENAPEDVQGVKTETGKVEAAQSASGEPPPETPFVDRNGDGINDCMEHRFRNRGKGRGKASSGKGGRLLKGHVGAEGPGDIQGVGAPGKGTPNNPGNTDGNGSDGQGRHL